MSSRICKKCGTIEFRIWGTIGLFGWSILIGALGYIISQIYYKPNIVIVAFVFGVILILPMFFISFHEEREKRKNDTE